MLEAAGRAFATRGFHEASMDAIAQAAGISKPMLYNYFGSKEGLYFAYVDLSYREIIAAIDAAVAEAVEAGRGPGEQLRTGVRAYYRYVGEHRDALRVLFREVGDPGGGLVQQRRRLSRRVAAPAASTPTSRSPVRRPVPRTSSMPFSASQASCPSSCQFEVM